ncbi:MAG: SufE family protein [Patescibacteria group bacterium]|nr:SufE family protein [Patescibacteria group bacterium]MBU1062612.1 SufE family protein [Patescibacteria group bacterium]
MTIQEEQEKIINEFKIFDNWLDKYNYLIKLGKNLLSIDLKYKIADNLIKGCQVKTWFYFTSIDGKIFYYIDSESAVIKGIIVLLTKILSGQKLEDIKNADLYFIDKIGLREHFSPVRANSLFKMVSLIKESTN